MASLNDIWSAGWTTSKPGDMKAASGLTQRFQAAPLSATELTQTVVATDPRLDDTQVSLRVAPQFASITNKRENMEQAERNLADQVKRLTPACAMCKHISLETTKQVDFNTMLETITLHASCKAAPELARCPTRKSYIPVERVIPIAPTSATSPDVPETACGSW